MTQHGRSAADAASGSRASHEAASASSPKASIPNADELPIIRALEGRPSELTMREMWAAAGIIRALYEALASLEWARRQDPYVPVGEVYGHPVNAEGMAAFHAKQALAKAKEAA